MGGTQGGLVPKLEKFLLWSFGKRTSVGVITKTSIPQREGLLILHEMVPQGEKSKIQTERWGVATVFPLSEGPGWGSYQMRMTDWQIPVLSGGIDAFLETEQNKH